MNIIHNTSRLQREHWRLLLLSSLGGALEMYDFVIFAVFAVSIGQTFFPSNNAWLSLFSAFSAFAIGYLIRPIGGIFFSHFGDRYGRKTVFLISVFIMAVATIFMAILPGYAVLGAAGSIVFVLLRMCQGLAIGGELPGVITFVKEHIHTHPGLACGTLFLFVNSGVLLADIMYGILHHLTSPAYAWRIAFLLGGMLAIISYFLRKALVESPLFLKMEAVHRFPFLVLLHNYFRQVISGFLLVAYQASLITLLYLYQVSFLKMHSYTDLEITYATVLSLAIFSAACSFWGWLSDFVNKKILLMVAVCLTAVLSVALYFSIISHQYLLWVYAIFAFFSAMYTGPFSAYLAGLFPASVRFSGVAVCYNIAFALFAGLSPAMTTYLIHLTNASAMLLYMFLFASVLGVLGLLLSESNKQFT